jgi:hypothetical protein
LSTIYSRPLIYQFKEILFTIIILSILRRNVLENYRSDGMDDLGAIKWSLALCVFAVFVLVYFSLWKGVRSTGKVITFSLRLLSLSYSPHPGLKCFDGYKSSSCIIATSLGGSICIYDTPYLSIRVFDLIGLLYGNSFSGFLFRLLLHRSLHLPLSPPTLSCLICLPQSNIYRFNLSGTTIYLYFFFFANPNSFARVPYSRIYFFPFRIVFSSSSGLTDSPLVFIWFRKTNGAGVKKDRADSLMKSADETRLHCVLPLCHGRQQRCWCWSVVESHNSWASGSLCIRLYIVFRVCLLSHSTLTDYHPRVALLLDILNRV